MIGGLLVILLCLYFINKNINTKFEKLEDTIVNLNKRIRYLQQKTTSQEQKTNSIKKGPVIKKPDSIIEKPIVNKPIDDISKKTTVAETIPDKSSSVLKLKPTKKEVIESISKVVSEKTKTEPKKSWFETFKEKNPDLEKFIGENLINKIGILILVLGISFFVKYAIDKDWINEPARVGIGILCGSLVMAIAHKLKKNYVAFSSVLVAGAISIFYFTIYIAFHEYQLFSQTIAFSIMAIITAFSTLVSVSYDRQELAVLSLIGGFATPFMVSTGEGNYVVLFTYIAILNIGVLGVSYFKKWRIVTILAFIFTTLLYTGWLGSKINDPSFSHKGALLFATLYYFIFSITIVLNNLKNKGVFSTIEYFIFVANTFIFFGIGMVILKDIDSNFIGVFTLLLAIYNLVYAIILFKKFGLDKNAIYLLIGLALTFVTLTIPIQFEGNQITLFWALESVLLFWLSQKSKISSFKFGAIIVQVLTIISLLIDWERYYSSENFTVIFNPLFIAGFIVSISLFITYWLLKKEKEVVTRFFTFSIKFYKNVLVLATVIITYFTGLLEINYQSHQFISNQASVLSFPVMYHFVFVSLILYIASLFKKKNISKGALIVSTISIILYIVSFYKLPKTEIINNLVENTTSNYAFYFHYIILACLIYFGYQLLTTTTSLFTINTKQNKWLPWLFTFAIVYVLSNEIMVHGLYLSNSLSSDEITNQFSDSENNWYEKFNYAKKQINNTATQIIKIGYPILWGVFSFIFLIIGIRKQWKNLRIIALSLLGLTILKLFIYDIKNVSETGKIIAFILLGILILVISFVYQKIKKLVVDENSEDEKI
ncbi:DUF2339 domain-containing protein [Tenacibaculum halocynthiae]|uniref:DUF2339 domain-containing protein n=1 Tax=Tenacibaculum halocynthiae TaxID=1254437 RepID=UPI003D6499EC